MNIPISVKQIIDGLEYEGTIQIGEKKYTWTLSFGFGFDAEALLSGKVYGNTLKETMDLFRIKLSLDEQEVNISEPRTFVFLMQTVARLVLDFYQEPQTREFNEGSLIYRCAQMTGNDLDHLFGRPYEDVPTLSLSVVYDINDEVIPDHLKLK